MPALLSYNDAAQHLGIPYKYFAHLVVSGVLPSVRVETNPPGQRTMFNPDAITTVYNHWRDQMDSPPAPAPRFDPNAPLNL